MASSAPPSEFFPGIDFNISFYTEGDSSVTLNYVNSNFLKCVGYAYSRAISTSFNGVIYALDGINTTNITATGTITANLFSGSGASLTDLDATKITTGTINNDRITLTADKIPDLSTSKITTGILSAERGGTGVNGFGMYRILFGSGGNGPIATLPDLTFDGNTLTCYGEFNTFKGLQWGSQFSRLNRVLTANQYSTGSAIGDIVLISDAKLHLVGGSTGSTAPGLTINALNNIGIGTTTPAADEKLRVVGNTKTTGTATIDTNLVVGGSAGIVGTSQFTGNVGIGTTPHATYKLNVDGTINATNILLNGSSIGGSKWTNNSVDATRIYYNSGNVGIGTTNPISKLHIYDNTTDTTKLTIQNDKPSAIPTPVITPSGGTNVVGQITSSIDRYMIFTAGTSTFTVPVGDIACDIFMIGGGGGGSLGGGGAGACIVAVNQTLTTGTYNVIVGTGGTGAIESTAGNDSSISLSGGTTRYRAKGGGPGGYNYQVVSGGCGGGGGYNPSTHVGGSASTTNIINGVSGISPSITSTYVVFGTKGGNVPTETSDGYGGGGGIGGVGGNYNLGLVSGLGGDGLYQATISSQTYNFRTYFANNTTFGIQDGTTGNYYIGGGGGGGSYDKVGSSAGSGGKGGGGKGGDVKITLAPKIGQPNTGSGGGGNEPTLAQPFANGGSGIVIIRYRAVINPSNSTIIELINGITTDTYNDWRIGNYNGVFKINLSSYNLSNDVLSFDNNSLQLLAPYGIFTNSTITGSLRSNGILYADYGIIGTGNIQTTGNIYTQNGTITGNTLNTTTINTTGLKVSGTVGIGTQGYAIPNNFMSAGSLAIGNTNQNYGGGGGGWNTSTAGLLLECENTTEIAVHDAGASIHSLMYYSTNGNIYIGRNMGYGTSNLYVMGNSIWYGLATFYGEVKMAISVWHKSTEGYQRIFFGNGGETYYEGGGNGYNNGINMAHVFRRSYGDADIFRITTNGSFSYAGTNQYWSDIRIKKEIEDINDDSALLMILAVEPKTYKYIDGNKSKERVYGFIAQQIKEVIPEAVVIQNNIIPNIYKQCRCEENKKIYVVLSPDVVGRLIQLSELGKYKIVLVEDEYIEVEKHMESVDIPDGDNMVYGYEVDDFHTINKDYIYTLNVCATQELHRRMETQDKRIKELETKVEKLISYIYQ